STDNGHASGRRAARSLSVPLYETPQPVRSSVLHPTPPGGPTNSEERRPMRPQLGSGSKPTASIEAESAAAGRGGRASEARVAVDDRQRIEQNIHDGIQQRLTALRIRLSLAAERFADRDDQDAAATLLG